MHGNHLAVLQGIPKVQLASTSAGQARFRHEVGRGLQRELHAQRRQTGVGVNQQRDGAAHDGCRLAGAAQGHVGGARVARHAVGPRQGQGRALDAGRGDQAARGGDVRLDDVVELRRATGAPRGQGVVAPVGRPVGAHRTNRDHVGRVAGRGH